MMVQPVASEVIEYTDPHDKMVEVFIGIAIDARQGDVNQCRGTIQENMGYETSGQAEVLRQYLMQMLGHLEKDNAAYREILLCGGRTRPQGDDLLQAMNDGQDAILVNMKKQYYRARNELAEDDWARLQAWAAFLAEHTRAYRRYFGPDDLEVVNSLVDKFCPPRVSSTN